MAKTLGLVIASLFVLAGLGFLVTTAVVKPVSTDLSVIGQGKPTLVLAYENFSPTGGNALERLREIRAEYASRLHFVVADLGTPGGRAFASRFGVGDGQTVFFRSDGQPLTVAEVPGDGRALRALLDRKLAAAES